MKPNKKKEFEDWFDSYFCDQQGEDSPYRYEDVKQAFNEGWRKGLVKNAYKEGKLKGYLSAIDNIKKEIDTRINILRRIHNETALNQIYARINELKELKKQLEAL